MQVMNPSELCLEQKCLFHYLLNSQHLELEGQQYIGYGITVEMVDSANHLTSVCIPDITSRYETAQHLLEQARAFNVSPMCLRMFVEHYLTECEIEM